VLNEPPAKIRVILHQRPIKAPIAQSFALLGNAPDYLIGASIGFHGQKRI
jgi:hypothetical protein